MLSEPGTRIQSRCDVLTMKTTFKVGTWLSEQYRNVAYTLKVVFFSPISELVKTWNILPANEVQFVIFPVSIEFLYFITDRILYHLLSTIRPCKHIVYVCVNHSHILHLGLTYSLLTRFSSVLCCLYLETYIRIYIHGEEMKLRGTWG